MVSVEFFIDIM